MFTDQFPRDLQGRGPGVDPGTVLGEVAQQPVAFGVSLFGEP